MSLKSSMANLRRRYSEFLSVEIGSIEELWNGLQTRWEPADAEALRRKVHDLAGSGATFGFPSVSESAHALDLLLQSLCDRSPSESQAAWFETCLGALKQGTRARVLS